MSTYSIRTIYRKLLADTTTPVSAYLKMRDRFANAIMLESSDYHGNENPYSFICFEPMAEFKVEGSALSMQFPDGKSEAHSLRGTQELVGYLQTFLDKFEVEDLGFKFSFQGLFGYQAYDSVRHFESVEIDTYAGEERKIPDMLYHAYRYVIVINHFHNELFLFENQYEEGPSQLDVIEGILNRQALPQYGFETLGEESSNLEDVDFLDMVKKGIHHCNRGDVFQIVLSRQFSQAFHGDEFNVYRSLRAINPSPYLFYCDYGQFKLMGSSPEAQLIIRGNEAIIHPIAGTFRRTGNDAEDLELAKQLMDDPKENAEHVMLVDLARNDLSRNGSEVKVETYKEIQYYSHVIHLVSKVTAEISSEVAGLQLIADTFPAGTLSGAPKHRAMQLINSYENQNRGFYGGCIGYLGFNGEFNSAIIIRSLLSKQNRLYYQAGAGIVSKSDPESELQEVGNKLMACRKAIAAAENVGKNPLFSQA
ncbi:MAG: anthranilate synthase component I family protein [Bacteroidota bacterium]